MVCVVRYFILAKNLKQITMKLIERDKQTGISYYKTGKTFNFIHDGKCVNGYNHVAISEFFDGSCVVSYGDCIFEDKAMVETPKCHTCIVNCKKKELLNRIINANK